VVEVDATRWQHLSLAAQLGNIASELSRAQVWHERGDESARYRALERSLELADATLSGSRGVRLRELTRLRSAIANTLVDRNVSWLPSLVELLLPSAILARSHRSVAND